LLALRRPRKMATMTDDAIIRKRLHDGSLTVGDEPPVDTCVKKLIALRRALLDAAGDIHGGNGGGGSGGGDAATARAAAAAARCTDFCTALNRLEFHLRQTRHSDRVVAAETAAYTALQKDIDLLEAAARVEIVALKEDLKAAYQTHLNKEVYEVSERRLWLEDDTLSRLASVRRCLARLALLLGLCCWWYHRRILVPRKWLRPVFVPHPHRSCLLFAGVVVRRRL
jgi:hypothetical protein